MFGVTWNDAEAAFRIMITLACSSLHSPRHGRVNPVRLKG